MELDPTNEYFSLVGAKVTSRKKAKLPYVLGSLTKMKSDKVMDWIKKKGNEVIVSAKLDGASIYVEWENGKVIFASTRGDGYEGQDITEKAKFFVPDIPTKNKVCLRGEALLVGDSYKRLGFTNRRNGVAGLLNRDDVSPEDLYEIDVVFYEYINNDSYIFEYERLNYIEWFGLNVVPYTSYSTPTLERLNILLFEYKNNCKYDVDGLVITRTRSSRENAYYPLNKIAYKVNEEAVKVKVIGIEWNVGRSGRIVPTVLIEPTIINDTTIARATGFNAKYIQDNKIKEGSIIGVIRSGEVIPYITEVFKS